MPSLRPAVLRPFLVEPPALFWAMRTLRSKPGTARGATGCIRVRNVRKPRYLMQQLPWSYAWCIRAYRSCGRRAARERSLLENATSAEKPLHFSPAEWRSIWFSEDAAAKGLEGCSAMPSSLETMSPSSSGFMATAGLGAIAGLLVLIKDCDRAGPVLLATG